MARRARKSDSVPAIEWIAGLCSLALVLGTLAFLAFQALHQQGQLPDLRLDVAAVTPTASGHTITVVVRNMSHQAAAEVAIEGVAAEGKGNNVRAEARLDYVPGLSERRAILVFQAPVNSAELKLRVLGYTTP
jgi:uncharacterized protein (TIGR02588 family)